MNRYNTFGNTWNSGQRAKTRYDDRYFIGVSADRDTRSRLHLILIQVWLALDILIEINELQNCILLLN